MILVISPLGEGETTGWQWIRVASYSLGLCVSAIITGVLVGTIGSQLAVVGVQKRLLILALILLVMASRELGLVRFRLPYRNWQMPSSWLRWGSVGSALLFGLTMGVGVLTRAPMASFHGTLAANLLVGSVALGGLLAIGFAVGRVVPVAVATMLGGRATWDPLSLSGWFLNRDREWRLFGSWCLVALCGTVVAAALLPVR